MVKILTENALRKRATRQGYLIQKTRTHDIHQSGEYRIVNRNTNVVEMGQGNHPLSFDELIEWFETKKSS